MKIFSRNFSKKILKDFGKLHSPENAEESFMLANRFVSRKMRRGFDENKLEKVLEKCRSKKTKTGYSVLGLRKPKLKQKIIHFEKSQNAENCKREDYLRFFDIHSVAKISKN